MVYDKVMQGEQISLRAVTLDDCNQTYVNWLADTQVNRYLETRWEEQTLDRIKEFVDKVRHSEDSCLFAIVENRMQRHIGNIKIGPIHPHYQYADVSYFIGEKECWGKGYATEAIALATKIGFEEFKLHKLQAGTIGANKASEKALKKVGYVEEGCLREQLCTKTMCEDHYFFGIIHNS